MASDGSRRLRATGQQWLELKPPLNYNSRCRESWRRENRSIRGKVVGAGAN